MSFSTVTGSTVTGFKLSAQQQQIWQRQSELGKAALTAQGRISLRGPLDPVRLHGALQTVVKQFEIFRTTFQQTPGLKLPLQVIQAPGDVGWQVVDLTSASKAAQTEAIEAFQEAEQLARESSAGLNWNLAILYWSRGDLDEATRRFDLAERVSKASFMDKDKRAVRSRFDQVKKRLLLEQGVRGTSSNELRRATRRSFAPITKSATWWIAARNTRWTRSRTPRWKCASLR